MNFIRIIISTSYKQNIIQYTNIATQRNFKEANVGFISIPINVCNSVFAV